MGMKISKDLEKKVLDLAGAGKADRKPRPARKLAAGWAVELTLPCVVRSEANQRCHWVERKRRFDVQRQTLHAVVLQADLGEWYPPLPCVVTFTHVGRRMDDDNLAGAFKGLRDALADRVLGVDDGDDQIGWRYLQEPGTPGVRVRIEMLA